jgi:hypothetical protein
MSIEIVKPEEGAFPDMSHTHSGRCGTAFRGCAPECPKRIIEAYDEKIRVLTDERDLARMLVRAAPENPAQNEEWSGGTVYETWRHHVAEARRLGGW